MVLDELSLIQAHNSSSLYFPAGRQEIRDLQPVKSGLRYIGLLLIDNCESVIEVKRSNNTLFSVVHSIRCFDFLKLKVDQLPRGLEGWFRRHFEVATPNGSPTALSLNDTATSRSLEIIVLRFIVTHTLLVLALTMMPWK